MFDLTSIVNINPAEYSAEYSAVPLSTESSTCKLPDQIGITPLIPIDLPNIPLQCTPHLITPIPIPYSCVASVSGTITFKPTDGITINGDATNPTDISVKADSSSECGYSLNGTITIGGGGGGGGGVTGTSGSPTPSFACSDASDGTDPIVLGDTLVFDPPVLTEINLDTLNVSYIAVPDCCTGGTNYIDLCLGELYFYDKDFYNYTTIKPSVIDLYASSGSSAALTFHDIAGSTSCGIDVLGADGEKLTVGTCSIDIIEGGTLHPAYIKLAGGASDYVQIASNQITISEGTSNTSELDIYGASSDSVIVTSSDITLTDTGGSDNINIDADAKSISIVVGSNTTILSDGDIDLGPTPSITLDGVKGANGGDFIVADGSGSCQWTDLNTQENEMLFFDGTDWQTVAAPTADASLLTFVDGSGIDWVDTVVSSGDLLIYDTSWTALTGTYGDMLIYDGSSWSALTAGNTGDVLMINVDGYPEWTATNDCTTP